MTDLEEKSSPHDWITAARGFGIQLTKEQIAKFNAYEALLLEWNERINLTAITDPADIRIRHFLDSLSCSLLLNNRIRPGQQLLDIGTGAGFPAIPLKIVFPQLSVTLVDSVAKKVAFLDAVIAHLSLEGIEAVASRAETLGRDSNHRERYDWVVARSVAEMRVLSEYLLPLCRVGGFVLAQKGSTAPDESRSAAPAITRLGGTLGELIQVNLPGHDQVHYLVVIEKVSPTPAKFPRRPGMPGKRPLA